MKVNIAALVSGFLFAIGLGVSGMTLPSKVMHFLDVTGDWDPSLACVMLGACIVYAVLSRVILRRSAPVFASKFIVPSKSARVDRNLVVGAAIFGVGWGIGGICPGPSIVILASRAPEAIAFFACMLIGMYVSRVKNNSARLVAAR
jgi:uncharacterized membrane protein YedE/YeeE